MSRAELIDTAIKKLDEAAMLLMAAGEDRLAADAEELAEWVDFKALPLETEDAQKRIQQLRLERIARYPWAGNYFVADRGRIGQRFAHPI